MTLLERLRAETAQSHKEIEANPVLSRLLSADLTGAEYKAATMSYYGFFLPLEKRLSECEEWAKRIPEFSSRLRSPRLRADLEALEFSHAEIRSMPLCRQLPILHNFGSFLGVLYVLEGSNLGGRLIAKHLKQFAFAQNALSFFNSDAAQTSRNWKSFLAVLEAPFDETEALFAVQGAKATFSLLDKWMSKSLSGPYPDLA